MTLMFLLCLGCQMDKRLSKLETGMTKAQVLTVVGKRPKGGKTQDGGNRQSLGRSRTMG